MTKPTVLLVEDDPSTCTALRLILSRKGWDVTVARNLAEAFLQLAGNPKCVVLDLMLPDGSGRQVIEHLRRENLSSRVIVTTGSNDSTELLAVKLLNPAAILQKPIELGDLLRIMGE